MATTTNYSFPTPDDTDLVKDGASAIRSLGTAVDTQMFTNAGAAINKSIVDAKGDLIVASGADAVARLAVGTNDYVLTADSAETNGVKWAALPTGGGLTLINTGGTTLSGTTTTISSIPGTYKHLFGYVENAYGAANDNNVGLRFNADTGSNYFVTEFGSAGASLFATDYTQTRLFRFTSVGTGTGYQQKGFGTFWIGNYATSDYHAVEMQGRGKATASNYYSILSQGVWDSASAITSVSIVSDSSMSGGKVYLYGVA